MIPWTAALFAICLALSLFLTYYRRIDIFHAVIFLSGIYLFGLVFAVNSSIHSYLIIAYSEKDKVAMTIGYYYMANAGGRLFGTIVSGFLYFYSGLASCLWASCVLLIFCMLANVKLKKIE